jgi:hypothetical protein
VSESDFFAPPTVETLRPFPLSALLLDFAFVSLKLFFETFSFCRETFFVLKYLFAHVLIVLKGKSSADAISVYFMPSK